MISLSDQQLPVVLDTAAAINQEPTYFSNASMRCCAIDGQPKPT